MIQQLLKEHTHDAVYYFADQVLSLDEFSPGQAQEATKQVAKWLAMMPGQVARDMYADEIFKQHKKVIGKKGNLTALVKEQITKEQSYSLYHDKVESEEKLGARLPDDVDVRTVMRNSGWYQVEDHPDHDTGIYFIVGMDQDPVRVTNFTIKPLFHKLDREDNSRIIEINNGFEGPQIIEMPSAAMLSRDSFRKFLFDKGIYHFDGTAVQLDKIIKQIMTKFPKAWELKELGWQPEGFFAYFNYSFNGQLAEYNEAGLVKHKEKFFYSPAVSKAYSEERKTNDQFENDRFLQYAEPPITFSEWCKSIKTVYPEHAIPMIGSALLALHRDIHFKIDNNCPHIYFYGESGSGKSKAAESVSNLFFKELPAFALSSGTDFAFAQRLGRYRNCPVQMNEFDTTMIKAERVNQIKNAYDGEGREKGTGGTKNKTTTQKVECLLFLIGQFLVTDDDMSIVNRSIVRKFTKNSKRSEKAVQEYDRLKMLEKKGLGGVITELMPYRDEVEKKYYKTFHEVMHGLAKEIRQAGEFYQERVLRNYSTMPTLFKIFEAHFDLQFSYKKVYTWAKKEIIALSSTISKGDVLMKFWNVLEVLVSDGRLRYGRHYMVDDRVQIKNVGSDKAQDIYAPGKSRRILIIRLQMVHQEYMKHCRSTGERPMDLTSLENYLKDKEYCKGRIDQRFTEITYTSNGRKTKSVSAKAWVIDMLPAGLIESSFNTDTQFEQLSDNEDQGKGDEPANGQTTLPEPEDDDPPF